MSQPNNHAPNKALKWVAGILATVISGVAVFWLTEGLSHRPQTSKDDGIENTQEPSQKQAGKELPVDSTIIPTPEIEAEESPLHKDDRSIAAPTSPENSPESELDEIPSSRGNTDISPEKVVSTLMDRKSVAERLYLGETLAIKADFTIDELKKCYTLEDLSSSQQTEVSFNSSFLTEEVQPSSFCLNKIFYWSMQSKSYGNIKEQYSGVITCMVPESQKEETDNLEITLQQSESSQTLSLSGTIVYAQSTDDYRVPKEIMDERFNNFLNSEIAGANYQYRPLARDFSNYIILHACNWQRI